VAGRITETVQEDSTVRFALTGRISVDEAHYDIVDVFDGSGVVVLDGERSKYFYRWNRDLDLTAKTVVFDGQKFEGVTLNELTPSENRPSANKHVRSGILLMADQTMLGSNKFAKVRLDGTANFNEMMHITTKPALIKGLVRIGGVRLFRKLSSNMTLKGNNIDLNNLRATLNEGRVAGDVSFDLSGPLEKWTADLGLADISISEELGKSLRYFVPIVHIGEIDSKLTGKFGGEMHFHGVGLKTEDLQKSLGGTGEVHLRDFVVTGSPIMKVLTLQVRYFFTGTKYNFERADGAFEITDGRVRIKDELTVQGPLKLRLSGSAGLDGTLDFVIHHNRLLPLTMQGTFDEPKVRLKAILTNPFK
jgi:hypothetical protein